MLNLGVFMFHIIKVNYYVNEIEKKAQMINQTECEAN